MTARIVSLHAAGAGLVKDRAERLSLVAGHGAIGDRHAGRDEGRALLVTGTASYEALAQSGLELAYGALGENLVIGGLDPHALPGGARLRAGSVLLELALACTVCSVLSRVDPRLPKLAYGRRGVYARVLQGGVVRRGQEVTALAPQTA